MFESGKKTGLEKRKMVKNWDPTDVDGYTGPWAKYVDEELVSKPDEVCPLEKSQWFSTPLFIAMVCRTR